MLFLSHFSHDVALFLVMSNLVNDAIGQIVGHACHVDSVDVHLDTSLVLLFFSMLIEMFNEAIGALHLYGGDNDSNIKAVLDEP